MRSEIDNKFTLISEKIDNEEFASARNTFYELHGLMKKLTNDMAEFDMLQYKILDLRLSDSYDQSKHYDVLHEWMSIYNKNLKYN